MATKFCSMKSLYCFCNSLLFIIYVSNIIVAAASRADGRKVYIVYLKPVYKGNEAAHLAILQKVFDSEAASKQHLIYSYRIINGFSATLTDEEREKLAKLEEVADVSPSRTIHLHGTKPTSVLTRPILP